MPSNPLVAILKGMKMPISGNTSNEVSIIPGASASVLQACLDDIHTDMRRTGGVPPSLNVALSCARLNPQLPTNFYWYSLRATVRWKGSRGGGQVQFDAHNGTCISLPATAIDVEVENRSDAAAAPDPDNINTFRVSASAGSGSTPHGGGIGRHLRLTEIFDLGAEDQFTPFIRVPDFCGGIYAYDDQGPLGAGIRVQFWTTPIPAVPAGLIYDEAMTPTGLVKPDGAEYVRFSNPGAEVAARVAAIFTIDM